MADFASDSEDDQDMKRAIALSLTSNSVGPPRQNGAAEVISIDCDSDSDEDLKRAIALSLALTQSTTDGEDVKPRTAEEVQADEDDSDDDDDDDDLDKVPIYRPKKRADPGYGAANKPSQEASTRPSQAHEASSAKPVGLVGLDRKAMEQERLARLATKRKAPESEQESQGRESRQRMENAPHTTMPAGISESAHSTKTSTANALQFSKGVVKKTFARGYPRSEDDITIDEIFQKDHLQLAVLSSFQWDEEWMLSKINTRKTKVCLIALASSRQQQEEMKTNAPRPGFKFCFPQVSSWGTMHSKLQLLKFAKYLRIVVPTGNLVPHDWGESGIMENMVFIIDLPLIEDPERCASNVLTPFGEELTFFLNAQGLEQSLIKSLEKYDFSETSRYAFIHSIGTSSIGNDWKRTGYCGLGRAVSRLGLKASHDVELDYVVSSLGAVKHDLITAIYYAAQGDSGTKELRERPARVKRAKDSSAETVLGKINDRFRIYFPSHDTVAQSRGGRQSGGTICAQSKWWNADSFPRHLVHDSKNVRPGLLMHTKVMLVRSTATQAGSRPVAWAYVGSANLSESAWGRLTEDKKTGNPKLTCRNWECGVLVPITEAEDNGSESRTTADEEVVPARGMSIFLGSVPVPIIWPSEAYGRTGAKEPWLHMEA